MEYFLSRAMEIARLSDEQLSRLQAHEKSERIGREFDPNRGTFKSLEGRHVRCLMPFEIQAAFDLAPFKDHYAIPEDEAKQSQHGKRLKSQIKQMGFINGSDLNALQPEKVHEFDKQIREAVLSGKLDLHFSADRRSRLRHDFSKGDA